MTKNKRNSSPVESNHLYEIKVKGRLAAHWSDWIGGMQVSEDEYGNTNLKGFVADQSALHGILAQIRNLGLELISVIPLVNHDEEQNDISGSVNDASGE